MRSISSAFKTALVNDHRAYLEYADFVLTDSTELHLTNADFWQNGFSIEDAVSSGGKFQLGSAIINKATLVLNNIYEEYDEYEFYGAIVTLSIGLELNGAVEKIQLGKYTVVEHPTYNGSLITIEMYDNMWKFDRPYNESDRQTPDPLVYPATLDTIVRDACTKCGLTLITTDFPNKSFVVSERPDDEKLTFREVLAYAAQIAGCYARCDSNGYLTLKWFDQEALVNTTKNICDDVTLVNGSYYNDTGVITSSGNLVRIDDYIPVRSGEKYLLRITPPSNLNQNRVRVHEYNSSKTWLRQKYTGITQGGVQSDYTWDISNDASYIRISFPKNTDVLLRNETVYGVHYINQLYSKRFSTDDVVITGVRVSIQVEREVQEAGHDYTTTTYEEVEYLYGSTGYVISVEDNPLIAEEQVQTVATYLGTRINGFAFRTADVSHGSDPSIEAGDVMLCIDVKNKRYPMLVSSTKFHVGNAQKTQSIAEEPIRNTSVRYTAETKNYVETRKLLAAEKTDRERIIQDLNDRIDNAQGLFETQVTDVGGGVITYLHDKPLLDDSDIQIKISTVGVTVTPNGTAEIPTWYGLTVDGQLIANILTTSGINADWINTGQLVITSGGTEVFFADVDTGVVRISGNAISITAGDYLDTAINTKASTATRTVLDNAQAYGLGVRVNKSGFSTNANGNCYYHGYSSLGNASNADGWVQWNGATVTIPKGRHINPGTTMPFGATLYNVYRTSDQSWHDVTCIESSNTWEANTYSGSTPSARTTWTWNEATDIVLVSYSIASSGAAITDAKLFTPPKKFSELAEVASMKAKLYTDTTLSDFATTVNAEISDIQAQLDGVVDTYYYPYEPTTNNIPASDWTTTALKEEHEGDLFLDTSTGKSYRWVNENNTWQWKEIPDTASAQALLAAQNAQDTADHKRRVFVSQPYTPYDIGDLWMQGSTGDIMTCINNRSTGDYVSTDWSKLNKYTDDTATNALAIRVTDLETETVAYYMEVSQAAVVKANDGTYTPSTITLSAKSQKIGEALSAYSGRFTIETQSGSTWTTQYTSSSNESSKTYTIPSDITAIRCSLYQAGGTTTLLDQQTVPIVSDGVVGRDGERGTGVYKITTAPSSYTTPTGGFTPTYRISLATVKTQAGVTEVLVGDVIEYSYYHYPVGYVDASYVYTGARTSIRGASGTAGLNNATVTLYQRGSSAPTVPAGDLTYTFATGVLSGSYLGSWSQTIPTGTDPVYAIVATASANTATDTIGTSEWSDPLKILENGEDGTDGTSGYNQATIFLYQRATETPSKPSSAVTYTFATGALSPVPTGWSRTVPSGTAPCYVTTAAAIGTGATYQITTDKWSAVVKLTENGQDGADGKDAYTVILTNESHGFAGSATNAAIASSVTTEILAWKGTTPVTPSSITISQTPTGMTVTRNGTVLTISVTSAMTTRQGTLTITATIDGQSFPLTFSYTLNPAGERGATWYPGTAITGKSTTPTVYPNTGIVNAMVDDHYLNTSTQDVYVCTLGGNANTAKWKYEQNIKGEEGTPGSAGSNAYLHVKYSDDGGITFTGNTGEDPGEWIGTYTDSTQADSTTPSDYTWAKIKGDTGEDGEDAYFLETPFTWTQNGTIASFEAIIYKGEEIVTDNYPTAWFEWFLRNENGENRIAVGKTCSVAKSNLGYGSTITCVFTTYDNQNSRLLTRSAKGLLTKSGLRLTTFLTADGDQKVTELPYKTSPEMYPNDYIMGIDAADGYQASMADIADYLLTNSFDTRNLMTYPYSDGTRIDSGVTFVDNGDGSITATGTATANTTFEFRAYNAHFTLPPGSYFINQPSGVSGSTCRFRIDGYKLGEYVKSYTSGASHRITILEDDDIDSLECVFIVYADYTVNSVTFIPQIYSEVPGVSVKNALGNRIYRYGDTMEQSALTLRSYNISDTIPQTTQGGQCYLNFQNVDRHQSGWVQSKMTADGYCTIDVYARYPNTTRYAYLRMGTMADGTQWVGVSSAAAWRTALGVVNKAGDIMTGDLQVSKTYGSHFLLKSTDVSTRFNATAPSTNRKIGGFQHIDSNDSSNVVFYSETYFTTERQQYTSFITRRFNADASSSTSHGFYLRINNDGTLATNFTTAAARDAWMDGLNALSRSGGSITGQVFYDMANVDASKANNNLSSNSYPTCCAMRDSANRVMVRLEGQIGSNGNIASSWYVRNYNTSGKQVAQKGILMSMNKSGTLTYTVSDSDNFRSAIGLGNVDNTSINTATIADIITVNTTNATITSANYVRYGKIAQIYIVWTNKSAITVPANGNVSNITVGTLVSDKRPYMTSCAVSKGDNAGQAWYAIYTGGGIALSACEGTGSERTIAAGTQFEIFTTFVLP